MQDYTIGENYTLPSLGKVYNVEVNPDIKIRSMTTEEEMKRVASVDAPYKNMCEIIDDCLVENPGISAYDMCIGDYQFLLHKLRVVTYGAEYPVTNSCIYCGCENTDMINLDELEVLTYSDEYEMYREFDLPKSGHHIRLKPQTPRMLDELKQDVAEFNRKTKGRGTDPTLVYLLMQLIESIDGKIPNPLKIEEWLRKLPMADTNIIINCADKMNYLIGVNADLTCHCDVCGLDFNTTLHTSADFFRPALDFGR